VLVFDGASCNARVRSGCATPPVKVSDAGGIGVVVDDSTGTLYIANPENNTVTVVDTRTCNAHVTAGCADAHPAVPVRSSPSHLAIDQIHHTLYASNEGADGSGDTVSMIDTTACNGATTTGCAATPPTLASGKGPSGLVVDQRTHTLYVSNGVAATVSVVDTVGDRHCSLNERTDPSDVATRTQNHVSTRCAWCVASLRWQIVLWLNREGKGGSDAVAHVDPRHGGGMSCHGRRLQLVK
jgi:hypothetical protein